MLLIYFDVNKTIVFSFNLLNIKYLVFIVGNVLMHILNQLECELQSKFYHFDHDLIILICGNP